MLIFCFAKTSKYYEMKYLRSVMAMVIFFGGIFPYAVAQDDSSEEGGTLLEEPEVETSTSSNSSSEFDISTFSSGNKTTNFSNGTTPLPAALVPEQVTLSTVVKAAVTSQVPVSLDNRNDATSNSTETPVSDSEEISTEALTTQKPILALSTSPASSTTSDEAGGDNVKGTTDKMDEEPESDNHAAENEHNEAVSLIPAVFPWDFLLISLMLLHN